MMSNLWSIFKGYQEGVERSQVVALGTTLVARKHHQSGGCVVVMMLVQGKGQPCKCLWTKLGPNENFTKMKGCKDLKVELGDYLF